MSIDSDAPPTWPSGTAPGDRYQPLPGDLCELQRGGPEHVHGSRLVVVQGDARGHGVRDQWWVRAPGEAADWCVELDGMALVRRPAVVP